MTLVFERLGLLESEDVTKLLALSDKLSRKITTFSRGL